jgi:hypothetical protein
MKTPDWWLRLKSHLTNKRVPAGYGFTNDDSVTTAKELTQEQLEKPVSGIGAKCTLRPDVGRWEVVRFVRKGRDSFIEVRHILSGEKMTVSVSIYTLIFQNQMTKP